MTISELAIRKPVFTWMLMAGLLVFGGISFTRMGVSQLPDVDFPVVNVSVTFEGAAPEVMELDIVDPIESAMMTVEGVESISSTARSGSANITVEFGLDKDIDVAVQEIQTKLGQAQRRLPKGIEPPVVTKSNPEDQPILWMSVTAQSMTTPELMAFVRDNLRDRFSTVPGVSEVFLGGYVEPNLRVWVNRRKLDQYALTVGDVINTIQQEHAEPPAGRIETPTQEINVRTMGEAATAQEFGKLVINKRGGAPNFAPIYLQQVARVEEGLEDIRRKSRVLGIPAVGLGIRKQRGVNAVEVAKSVKARMAEVSKELPEGLEIGLNFDTTQFIEEAADELNFTLVLSAILTALVCWMFLGSWSATLNVILAIPTAIIGTFIVLNAMGFTLNTFTMLGLSLAIGVVVDDAIMVLENIVRHKQMGKDKVPAASEGAREVFFAALAATAAIIAVFLPVAFMEGLIGKYFYQFGVTISVAVAISLVEAVTLTPMRCSQFLEVGERTTRLGRWVEGGFEAISNAYSRMLPVLLNWRWLTVILAMLFFVGSLGINSLLKKEFVPAQDQGRLLIRLKTPEGSSLAVTDAKMAEVEAILSKRPEVRRYFGSVGGFGGGDVNTAILFVTMAPLKERTVTQQQLADELRREFRAVKGAKAFVQDLSLAGFSARRGFPIEVSIRGPEWGTLIESAQKLMAEMEKTGLVTDIDSELRDSVQEVHVVPDRERARARGVSVADIGQTISSLVGGTIAGRFSRGGRRYDIRVKLDDEEQVKPEDLKRFNVRNNRGELIPLAELVKIEKRPSLRSITRQDRERSVAIYANVAANASQAKAMEEIQKVAATVLPDKYHLVPSGSAKSFKDSFQSLIFALLLGIVVSYMVLASQFNHFMHPITVLLALPFSVTGAFIALYLGGQSLNIYSMIGLILLMGIVKKNSILLVDFTNQMRERGMSVREALIHACPVRLRPIVMTSFATIAGAVPPALAIGPGAETRVPMALAVIGGVVVSTVLTLFVVPCFYSLVAREKKSG